MISSALIAMSLFITSVIVLWSEHNYEDFLAEMIVNWVAAVVVLFFWLMLFFLFLFHVYLICVGTTTYLYFKERKEKQQAQMDNSKEQSEQ